MLSQLLPLRDGPDLLGSILGHDDHRAIGGDQHQIAQVYHSDSCRRRAPAVLRGLWMMKGAEMPSLVQPYVNRRNGVEVRRTGYNLARRLHLHKLWSRVEKCTILYLNRAASTWVHFKLVNRRLAKKSR